MLTQKLCGAILTALLISGCMKRAHPEVDKLKCGANLKTLYTFGMIYGKKKGEYFPHSPDGSIASLQLLVDYYPQDNFNPEIFICPGSDADAPPATDVNGELVLTPENCSYESVPWKLKITERNAIWLYDKAQHHPGGRNVVLEARMNDGARSCKLLFMDEETFQKRLSEDRKRFGASE